MTSKKGPPQPLQLGAALLSSTTAAALVPGATSPLLEQFPAGRSGQRDSPVSKDTRKLLLHLKDSLDALVSQPHVLHASRHRRNQHGAAGAADSSSSSEEDNEQGQADQAARSTRKKKNTLSWASQALTLAVQLRDLLLMSQKQSWSVLAASSDVLVPQLATVLSQLVVVASSRLLQAGPHTPPYALQSVCIDLAVVLLDSVDDSESEPLFQALLHGLNGFADGLKFRILNLYNASFSRAARIPQMRNNSMPKSPIPAIAISSDGQDATVANQSASLPNSSVNLYPNMVPLLLVRIFRISPSQTSLGVIYALHRLLRTLLLHKSNLHLDVIKAIASTSSNDARARALAFMSTYWPSILGHTAVTPPFGPFSYVNDRLLHETRTFQSPATARANVHNWIPWHWSLIRQYRPDSITDLYSDEPWRPPHQWNCRECSRPMKGFGLRCMSGSHESVHLECYASQEGCAVLHYISDSGKTRLSFTRYCIVHGNERAKLFPSSYAQPEQMKLGYHRFSLVNVFTLTVCFLCNEPMWGIAQQGYRCSTCAHFAHSKCLARHQHAPPPCLLVDELQLSEILVDFESLRATFVSHYTRLSNLLVKARTLSYVERLLLADTLRKQAWLLESGIAASTIVISSSRASSTFELHDWLSMCEDGSDDLASAPTIQQYFRAVGRLSSHELLSNDGFLDLCAAQVFGSDQNSMSAVGGAAFSPDDAHRGWGIALGLQDNHCAVILLGHLQFTRRLISSDSHVSLGMPGKSWQMLVPSLLSPSSRVLDVLQTIGACLASNDLQTQESGLRFLVQHCQPNPIAPWQAMEELLEMLLRWVLDEAGVVRAAQASTKSRQQSLAEQKSATNSSASFSWSGRRKASEVENMLSNGSGPNSITGATVDYAKQRRRLLDTYIKRWMAGMHSVNPDAFEETVYLRIEKIVSEKAGAGQLRGSSSAGAHDPLEQCLKSIIKLVSKGLLNETFDALLSHWLEQAVQSMSSSSEDNTVYASRTLAELFGAGEQSHTKRISRLSMSTGLSDSDHRGHTEPWTCVLGTAERDSQGLKQALRWMTVIAASGATPTTNALQRLQVLLIRWQADFETVSNYIEAVFRALLQHSFDRRSLADAIFLTIKSQIERISSVLQVGEKLEILACLRFLQRCQASLLLVFEFPAQQLVDLNLVKQEDIHARGRSRQASVQPSPDPNAVEYVDDLEVYERLINLTTCTIPEVRRVITVFVEALLSPACKCNTKRLFRQLGHPLASMVFRIFEGSDAELAAVRVKLLLRILAGNPKAFHDLLKLVNSLDSWDQRFISLDSVFHMVSEFGTSHADPSLLPGLPEMTSVIKTFILSIFDKDEYVRMKVEVLVDSLQPGHYRRMSSCFERKFATAPTEDQLVLLAFALRIAPKLPHWQVLSFRLLFFAASPMNQADTFKCYASAVALSAIYAASGHDMSSSETALLRSLLLQSLGLDNRSSTATVPEDASSSQRTKLSATIGDIVLPAIRTLLDAPTMSVKTVADASTTTPDSTAKDAIPVVHTFYDILPRAISAGLDVSTLTYGQARNVLECILIATYKLGVGKEEAALREATAIAIRRLAEALSSRLADDNKSLLLMTMQVFLKRFSQDAIAILGQVIIATAEMLQACTVAQKLRDRSQAFLRQAFQTFPENGLFVLFFKNVSTKADCATKDFFDVLADYMREHPDQQHHPINDVIKSFPDIIQRDQASVCVVSFVQYVVRCYTNPLSEGFLTSISQFLQRAFRGPLDWTVRGLQGDDPLDLCRHLLDRMPGSTIIMPAVGEVLQKVIANSTISRSSLAALVNSLQMRLDDSPGQASEVMGTLCLLPDLLAEGVRERQNRPVTLSSLIETYLEHARTASVDTSSKESYPTQPRMQLLASRSRPALSLLANEPVKLAYDTAAYLSAPLLMPRFTEDHLLCLTSVAKLFIVCAGLDGTAWQSLKSTNPRTRLFVMNFLSLATVTAPDLAQYAQMVWTNIDDSLEQCYEASNRDCLTDTTPTLDMLLSFRLSMVLVRHAYLDDPQILSRQEARLANLFLPHCEMLVTTLLDAGDADEDARAISSVASSGLCDTISFVSRLRPASSFLLEHGGMLQALLDMLQDSGGTWGHSAKMRQAMQILAGEQSSSSGGLATSAEKATKALEKTCRTDLLASCHMRHMAALQGL